VLSDRLSVKERAALLALLTEPGGLSNPELERRVGFRLDGKERRRLNDLKLVDSRKDGQAYVHELSDKGWRWCADEFVAEPGPRPGSMERTLYALLPFVRRHLDGHGENLADLFAPGTGKAAPEHDAEADIAAGYRALTSEPGAFVKLAELREKLTDLPRAETDAALDRMYRAQQINLIPQSNRRELTEADHESALRIGGEDKHLISIEFR
jgi:hypothetical protein